MSRTMIEVNHLTKIYKLYDKPSDRVKETFLRGRTYSRDFYALRDISFSIPQGSTIGIIGKNGSGKSTLLKILTGVLKPTLGEVDVRGKISALLELGAGFNMDFTGRENIYLNGTVMRIPRAQMDARIDDILAFADIGEYIDQPVKMYSSGMFVRLAFAVAINVDPEILIVDEALAVGDTRFQLKCMDKFSEFQKAGKTILFVSHDINSIKRFCERTIWINEGRLIMDGETDLVTDLYTDFLKSEMGIDEYLSRVVPVKAESESSVKKMSENVSGNSSEDMEGDIEEEDLSCVDIAEIRSVELSDENGAAIANIRHGSAVKLKISYVVSAESVERPVLGVAIRSIDNKYICGLNTMLDGLKIPWKRGRNVVELTYEHFNLVGGNYYFDVALMDGTATVNIDYKAKIQTFFVEMSYIAEGVVVLKHHWQAE